MSLRMAKKIALANDEHERWMLGCVISRNSSVLAVGWNKPKNDPAFIDDFTKCSVHAESDALSRTKNPAGATLYIARVCKGGGFGLAKPCKKCQQEIFEAGIKRVLYTINNTTHGVWKPLKVSIESRYS